MVVGQAALVALPSAQAAGAGGQSADLADAMGATFWTGTWTETGYEPGSESPRAGYTDLVDPVSRGTISADDPRIAGTWTQVSHVYFMDSRDPQDGEVAVAAGRARIDNDAGAWVGTMVSYSGQPNGEGMYVMEGEGAFEGLTAVFRWRAADSSYEGVILPTRELPSLPEPMAAPTE
jgi:hypothetical protein